MRECEIQTQIGDLPQERDFRTLQQVTTGKCTVKLSDKVSASLVRHTSTQSSDQATETRHIIKMSYWISIRGKVKFGS